MVTQFQMYCLEWQLQATTYFWLSGAGDIYLNYALDVLKSFGII